jgi:hypothetical protein
MQAQEGSTLAPEVVKAMTKGQHLGMVWLNPKYDVATGFTLGKVSTQAEGHYANSVDYFPVPLLRYTLPGSTNLLNVTVISLSISEGFSSGKTGAEMTAEGEIVDKDGQVMFAFTTREVAHDGETPLQCCETDMDRIAWSIFRELGKPLHDAVLARNQGNTGANPSGLPTRPKSADQTLTVGERLIQLDNLRKSGLLTQEEYDAKRAEILKGL